MTELPGRAGYEIIEGSRFDALEEELAALLVPWDSDADAARIARAHGFPDDARFIAAARARMRASHVEPATMLERIAEELSARKSERRMFIVGAPDEASESKPWGEE